MQAHEQESSGNGAIKIDIGQLDPQDLSLAKLEDIIDTNQAYFDQVDTFDFNIFTYSQEIGRSVQMPIFAGVLLKKHNLQSKVNMEKYLNFFKQIYSQYKRTVHYHNDLHGCDVAQHVHLLLNQHKLAEHAQFNDLDTLSILIAALCHDVGHDGFNNRYHVTTQSNLCQMYGVDHVQETYHAALTMKLFSNEAYNFISGSFSQPEVKLFKKRIVESILYTDMASMKDLRETFQKHLNQQGIKGGMNQHMLIDNTSEETTEKCKQLVSSVMLHACDISTSLREFDLSTKWANLLFEEFFNQGDTERAQSLEISMMCDRNTTNISGGQAGFIQFVVLPIFKQLSEISPSIEQCQVRSGLKNIEKWEIQTAKEKKAAEEAKRGALPSSDSKDQSLLSSKSAQKN